MERAMLTVVGLALLVSQAAAVGKKQDPVSEVVTLIQNLKAKLEADRSMEQKSYDKYACWCEKTLERKAKDIADAKARIEELGARILELTSKTSASDVDVGQLEKDINATKAAIAEATAVREKENTQYQGDRVESEQCIGALEAAIKALTGAGEQKKGFLQNMHEAQLLSIAGNVKGLLGMTPVEQAMSAKDLEVVRRFVDHPEDFVRPSTPGFLQMDNNPFGDYAPQSTQIQGILKGMYDAFAEALEKSNGEEAEKQKSFEEFMETKQKELETLEEAHLSLTTSLAEMVKKLADSKTELEDTKVQLEADEKFFADTKAACKAKASEWSTRSRVRTMELAGLIKAIEILTSPEAKKTFEASRTTLLQLSAEIHPGRHGKAMRRAYDGLRKLASRYGGLGLAQIAAAAKTGGHFDDIIVMIDKMIADLRIEGNEDIAHRDRCQVATNKNNNDGEDLGGDLAKAESELGRLQDEKLETEKQLESLQAEIEATKKDMDERLELRNEERKEFEQALKDDANAIEILTRAIAAIAKFYNDNKMPLELVQQEPEYTIDEDKAPETNWEGDYKGSKSETGGIIAILSMLKEDIENEMKTGRAEDAKAQSEYEKDRADMQAALDAQVSTELSLQKQISELDGKITDKENFIDQTKKAQEQNEKMAKTLKADCSWVETHFESRKEKRANEIAGLQEAKNILAGAESGDGDGEELS